MAITEEKAKGRFYTPVHIVRSILNMSGYRGPGILRRHAIDNSCGDGAFLAEMVRRYSAEAVKAGRTGAELARDLGTFIHGLEIDAAEAAKAAERADETARRFGAGGVRWDIRRGNTLTETRYDGKMDFVLGNPPYVRVHHLADTYGAIKKFRFAQSGMTDIFIAFYEIGLNMLRPGGTLGYITPSSLFHSKAAADLRRHLIDRRLIRAVADLKHYQPFDATTYTAIVILQKGDPDRPSPVRCYGYDPQKETETFIGHLTGGEFNIGGNFYFGPKKALTRLRRILNAPARSPGLDVKNGFATLLDRFFIGDLPFSDHVIPAVKASTGKSMKCLYPYDRTGRPVPFVRLAENRLIAARYREYETRLRGRSLADPDRWYEFGRTQGISDVYKKKYSVCPIIRTPADLKITFCGEGVGVYGGLYILTDLDRRTIEDALLTDDFMEYIALLGKYKSGGYYTFSSKDLKRYLGWKLAGES